MKRGKKLLIILALLLITLIFHLVFLYFFTTVSFSSASDRVSEFIKNLLNKSEDSRIEKPHLQAHAPQPSAPVIFKDIPEEAEPVPQKPKPEPIEPKTLVSHANGPQNKPKEQEITSKQLLSKQATKVVEETDSHSEKNEIVQESQERAENSEIKESPQPKNKIRSKNKNLENTMLAQLDDERETQKSTEKKSQIIKQNREHNQKFSPHTKTKSNTPSKKGKSLSLADLTTQYMQKVATTVDSSGYGSLKVEGNAQYGHPSAYQIALERYVTKMCKEIETAYRINTNQSIRAIGHNPFNLILEINANGSLATIYPYPSSGNSRIDEFAISVFTSASTSFPKLPEALGENLRIRFGIDHVDNLAHLSRGILRSE